MKEYQMTIKRKIIMEVHVAAYGNTEEEAKKNALSGNTSFEEEHYRLEQSDFDVSEVNGFEEIT